MVSFLAEVLADISRVRWLSHVPSLGAVLGFITEVQPDITFLVSFHHRIIPLQHATLTSHSSSPTSPNQD